MSKDFPSTPGVGLFSQLTQKHILECRLIVVRKLPPLLWRVVAGHHARPIAKTSVDALPRWEMLDVTLFVRIRNMIKQLK